MIVLFGGLALLLHERFAAGLDQSIDRSLRTPCRAISTTLVDAAAAQLPALPESGGRVRADRRSATGRVLDATPGYARHCCSPKQVERAQRLGSLHIDRQAMRGCSPARSGRARRRCSSSGPRCPSATAR